MKRKASSKQQAKSKRICTRETICDSVEHDNNKNNSIEHLLIRDLWLLVGDYLDVLFYAKDKDDDDVEILFKNEDEIKLKNDCLLLYEWISSIEFGIDGCHWILPTWNVAARMGSIRAIQWLHKQHPIGCLDTLKDYAKTTNNQRLKTRLRYPGPGPFCVADILSWSYWNLNQTDFAYVSIQCKTKCSTQTMDIAAQYGHLYIMKWLFKYRKDGCTSQAMYSVCRNGHLSIVQWLHENYLRLLSPRVITSATSNANSKGHYSITEYLHTTENSKKRTEYANTRRLKRLNKR
jgi:hypothetical protein